MPAQTSIREVAESLLARLDEMSAALVESYRQRIPEYPQLLLEHGEDVFSVTRGALLVFLRLLIEEREPTHAELSAIRAAGRARAAEGIPLESMLSAYSMVRAIAWDHIQQAAQAAGVDDEQIAMATIAMAGYMEKLSLMVTQGFLEHIRHAYEAEQKRLETLVEIVKAMSRSLELDEVAEVGLNRIRSVLGVEWAGLWLVVVEKGVLRLFEQKLDPAWLAGGAGELQSEIPLDQDGIGRMAVAGKPVFYRSDEVPAEFQGSGANFAMLVPLMHRNRPLGVVGVASNRKADLERRDRELLLAIADPMAIAIHQVQEHMREARTDFLTGLANRHEFDSFLRRELARAMRFGDALSLAMIDLDGLKRINDEHGHKAGDEALRTVGSTLKATVRSLDLAARIGGDEFALVMPQTDTDGAHDVVQRFLEHLAEVRGRGRARVTVSVGFAEWKDGMTLDSLAATADAQLYEAKRSRPLAKA